MPEQRTPTRRGVKKRVGIYTPVSFLIIVAALIFGMSIFFKVSRIEVIGAEAYTDEEIIVASGIQQGDNLFFINRITATSRIISKLPYIELARVNRALPNRVIIEITESTPAAVFSREGEYWVLDKSCKVLGAASAAQAASLVRVEGLEVAEPLVSTILEESSYTGKVNYLSEILRAMLDRDMLGAVSVIDLSNAANPTFEYMDRFTVKLGKNEDVEYKFELLLASILKLSDGEEGVFDLSIDKSARFSPR